MCFFEYPRNPGLVNFCGKQLDEVLRSGKATVTFNDWIQFASSQLIRNAPIWGTMRKLVDGLKEQTKIAANARNLLVQRFFPSNDPVELETDVSIGEYLAAEGALVLADAEKQVNVFKFPSLIVRNLLFSVVVPLVRHPIPLAPPPINNQHVDLEQCVIGALPALSKSLITSASRFAFKQAWVPASNLPRNTPVPEEAVYHFEHYALLRAWLPSDVLLLPESRLVTVEDLAKNASVAKAAQAAKRAKAVKAAKAMKSTETTKGVKGTENTEGSQGHSTDRTNTTDESLDAAQKVDANNKRSLSSKSCDLTIISGSKKYVIEYGATLALGDIRKHFAQAVNYAKVQGASEALFVHFTLVNTDTPNVFVFPESDTIDGVRLRVLHIVHNEEFTKVQVSSHDREWSTVNVLDNPVMSSTKGNPDFSFALLPLANIT